MTKYIALILAFCLVAAAKLAAQTPAKPVTHGTLPSGWQGAIDITSDNNGIFKIGFARVLKGDSGFGFIYEGANITVEQSQKTLAEWKKEMYRHMDNTGREDSQEKCRCTRLGDGNTKIAGYNAYFIGELQRCYKKADGRFDDEDAVRVYYVQVGKAAYYIYTESDSEKEGGTAEYEREIDKILASLRFFGSTGGNSDTPNPQPDPNTNTNNSGDDDEDISIGDVVIGAVVGGGVAGLAGWIIKSLLTKGKTAAATAATNNKSNNKPTPSKNNSGKKPATTKPKRKEDEKKPEQDKEDEKEDEEKKENERYVLQISQNNLELAVNQTAQIRIAVWHINPHGEQNLALDAPIQARSNSGALIISPTTGEGAIMLNIELRRQPDTDFVTIDVGAKGGSQTLRTEIKIKIKKSTDTYEFITAQVPPDKKELVADGHDVCYYYVQVRNNKNDQDAEIARLNANIRISNAGGDEGWLNLGEQKMIDGWQAIGFTASNPQRHLVHQSQVVHPPRQVSLLASVELPDGKILQKLFDFPLQQPAVLDVDNDSIYFPALPISIDARHQKQIDITAFIDAPVSGEKWTFEASYEAGKPQLTAISIVAKNDSQASIQLKTPTHSLIEGQASEFGLLIIKAHSDKRAAFNERQVQVTLRAEGIFVVKGLTKNSLQIWGDPEKEALKAEFAVFVWDEKAQEMRADRKAVEHLQFDFVTPNQNDKQATNLLSVAKVRPLFDYTNGSNNAIFAFRVENEIPGEDKALPFLLRLTTYSEITKQEYELIIDAAIFAQGIGASSEDWQREYDNCKLYIDRHVPTSHRADMMKMLEARKMTLGHEGLYYLRHQIHSIAQNLILAQGAQGYRDAEKWYTDVIELLQWCEWAGNLAFNIVAASIFGPYAPAVTIAKSYGIQALQYVLEGKTLEQWAYDSFTLHTLFKAAEGRLIDTEKIAEYFKNDGTVKAYAKAWAIFIAYHFAYNAFWEKRSVVESLKQVAREMRDEAIVTFFQRRLKAEADKGKDNMEIITDPIRKLRQGFVAKANGQHECKLDDVLECMRDPQTMRTLKKASPELQEAFNRSREALYKNHDDTVKAKLAEDLKIPAEDLRIDDFRTPGATGSSINTDRDYRMLYRAGKDANGNDVWFEVPKEKWQNTSYQTFGELTGKPAGMTDLEWAQKHLQLATDKAHIEASPDYSDHAVNPKTGEKEIIRPNIIAVEAGQSRLFDATALGNMYHEKVHASLRMGQLSEAIAQCKKGVDTLGKVREGYEMQHLNTGNLPKSIQDGMEVVRKAPTDRAATPEAMKKFNEDIKNAGFRSLEDFSNKLAAQFESLKKYDQQPAAHHFNKPTP